MPFKSNLYFDLFINKYLVLLMKNGISYKKIFENSKSFCKYTRKFFNSAVFEEELFVVAVSFILYDNHFYLIYNVSETLASKE